LHRAKQALGVGAAATGIPEEQQEPLVLLARAIIAYNEGHIPTALQHLKKMVDLNPRSPPDVWLGIGICYFKLKNSAKAKFALEHVLMLDPQNSMAMTALGVTELQISFCDQDQRAKAIKLFQKSFDIDDTNPLTMKHLADHFLLCNELDITEALCQRAIKQCDQLKRPDNSDLPTFRGEILILKSDLFFILGKVYHQREQYEEALNHYFQTVNLNRHNFAAHFYLAKIEYLNGNFNAVDEGLTRILSNPRYKDSYEAIKLLAKVKTIQGKRYEAMALYKRLLEINPRDHTSSFHVAQLFDQIDQNLALKYYEQGLLALQSSIETALKGHIQETGKADNMLDEREESEDVRAKKAKFYADAKNIVPPEILNNVGVLRMELAAQQKFQNAEDAR